MARVLQDLGEPSERQYTAAVIPRILLWALTGVSAFLLVSCDDGLTEEEAKSAYLARRKMIQAEVARLGEHPWAGTYSIGFMTWNELTLAPDAGMTFRRVGCLGTYEVNWGSVVVEGETLRFVPELEGYDGPEKAIVVPVGERVYLVVPEDMELFAGVVRSGGEPRSLDFLLRDDR